MLFRIRLRSPPPPVRQFDAGVAGLYELQVLLLGRAENVDLGEGITQTFGGGGLTAQYFANTRFMGNALVTRVRLLFTWSVLASAFRALVGFQDMVLSCVV